MADWNPTVPFPNVGRVVGVCPKCKKRRGTVRIVLMIWLIITLSILVYSAFTCAIYVAVSCGLNYIVGKMGHDQKQNNCNLHSAVTEHENSRTAYIHVPGRDGCCGPTWPQMMISSRWNPAHATSMQNHTGLLFRLPPGGGVMRAEELRVIDVVACSHEVVYSLGIERV